MGRRGTKPTPTKELKKRGSWRAKLNKKEPMPKEGFPKKPKYLKGIASDVWDEITQELHEVGLLTIVDGGALARYCILMKKFIDVLEFTESHGDVYPIKDKDGKAIAFKMLPQTNILLKITDKLLRIEQEFGLTPSSRTRIQTEIVIPKTLPKSGGDSGKEKILNIG